MPADLTTAPDATPDTTDDDWRPVLRLTGLGAALLDAETRITPDRLFTPEQYDAIRKAGLDIFYVRADSLIGGGP